MGRHVYNHNLGCFLEFHGPSFSSHRRKIEWKHFLYSTIRLGFCFILSLLMVINYAMYSKCLKGHQPKILVEVPITFQKNRKAYMQLYFHIIWVRNKAWCKTWSWLWKCSESSLTNPAEDHDANDTLCALFMSGTIDPDSLWSGFKKAEDYISFVCLLEGKYRETLFVVRSRQGHLP